MQEKPTALSKALGFLVRDFDVQFMWWELLMAWRQLWLVGFAVLIAPGSVQQLVISFLVSLVYMLICAVSMPFKDKVRAGLGLGLGRGLGLGLATTLLQP